MMEPTGKVKPEIILTMVRRCGFVDLSLIFRKQFAIFDPLSVIALPCKDYASPLGAGFLSCLIRL
jgi:hypothetical protein